MKRPCPRRHIAMFFLRAFVLAVPLTAAVAAEAAPPKGGNGASPRSWWPTIRSRAIRNGWPAGLPTAFAACRV